MVNKNTFIKCFAVILAFLIILPALSLAKEKNKDNRELDVDGTPLPAGVKYKAFVHYPGKQQPVLPACSPTTNDQVSDYGAVGWKLTGPRVYRLNESTVPRNLNIAGVYSAINTSWNTWNSADANILVSKGNQTLVKKPKYDGVNLLAWGAVPNNAIAVTYTWYNPSTGAQLESDVIFNSRLKWSNTPYSSDCGGVAGTYDFGSIAVHEFGHWVGLDDLYADADKDLTMYGYGFTAELKKDTLGLGDILGASAITP